MTDRMRGNVQDVPFKPAGTGLSQTFRCGKCSGFRTLLGRRLKHHRGMRQWLCKECAA